jgi:hypothetical protein
MRTLRHAGVVLALLAAATVTPAVAQHAQTRQGFFFSGGLGWGSFGLGCDGCVDLGRTGGASGYLKAGGTLSPNVLLGVETNGWYKSEDGASITLGNLVAAAYFYPMVESGLFLKGGVGLSTLSADTGFESNSDTGLGFTLGAGYDLRIGGNTSLTPVLNYFRGNFDGGNGNVFQMGLGITVH